MTSSPLTMRSSQFDLAGSQESSTRSARMGSSEKAAGEGARATNLLFHFHHFAALGLGLGDDLLLQSLGDDVVVRHFHVETAPALGHGSQVGAVGQHFRHRHLSFDDGLAALVVHALNSAPD